MVVAGCGGGITASVPVCSLAESKLVSAKEVELLRRLVCEMKAPC